MIGRQEIHDGFVRYTQPDGPTLGTAGAPILEIDGLLFRDLARTGTLLPYEDWRLDAETRARDLASRLSTEEIAGLMLYSPHQMIPQLPGEPFPATYDSLPFPESGKKPWALSDQQKRFLREDHIRHVLVMKLESTDTAVRWSNAMQAEAEHLPYGIPVNLASDPRHGASSSGAEYKSAAGELSRWPEGLGMGAAGSPELCRKYGEIVSRELRALGITTALFPQVDVGTEPRWMRIEDTFGSDPALVTSLGKAFCDGLQTTAGSPDGWGQESVCAMAKHWPGGAPCEGGRDAHYPFGKFAVYPGKCLNEHLRPFTEGVFHLDGPTGCVASVMPYYTISQGVDPSGQNVGNAYSRYLIHDLLRETCGYDGVVCTDWGITGDPAQEIDSFGSRCYGTETLTEAQRHLLAIENGVDQFGGNDNIQPVLEAYRLGAEKYGEAAMRARMEASAVRLLKNFFRCGLFENPYLDLDESRAVVGCAAHHTTAMQAQLHSLVLLKDTGVLPVKQGSRVYVPSRTIAARKDFFRTMQAAQTVSGADQSVLGKYFTVVDTAEKADFALVFVESPLSDGYCADADNPNGYRPISLQYRPYRADSARRVSIGGGDFREASSNRSYRGKTGTAANEADLDLILDTKRAMGAKPVIVCMRVHNPSVCSEFEPCADAILADFGVQQDAILQVIAGLGHAGGHLPVQFPADMETVEAHCEDRPLDLQAYTDQCGNCYDYGFGLG